MSDYCGNFRRSSRTRESSGARRQGRRGGDGACCVGIIVGVGSYISNLEDFKVGCI